MAYFLYLITKSSVTSLTDGCYWSPENNVLKISNFGTESRYNKRF